MVKDRLRLRKVILSPSVRRIDDEAFSNCIMLGDVVFSTGLKEIGKEAFAGCDYLALEELPEGLEKIEDQAFAGGCNLFASCDPLERFPESTLRSRNVVGNCTNSNE